MKKWQVWMRQPTTVAGLSTALGTLIAMILQQISWPQAIPLLAGATVSILLPDNTNAQRKASDLATEIVANWSIKKDVGGYPEKNQNLPAAVL